MCVLTFHVHGERKWLNALIVIMFMLSSSMWRTNGWKSWKRQRTCAGPRKRVIAVVERTGCSGCPLQGESISDCTGLRSITGSCGRPAEGSLKWPKPYRKVEQGSYGVQ